MNDYEIRNVLRAADKSSTIFEKAQRTFEKAQRIVDSAMIKASSLNTVQAPAGAYLMRERPDLPPPTRPREWKNPHDAEIDERPKRPIGFGPWPE